MNRLCNMLIIKSFNGFIRNVRIPIPNWRFRDAGHIHLGRR